MSVYYILTILFFGNGPNNVVIAEYNSIEKCQSAFTLMKNTIKKEYPYVSILGTCTHK